LNERSSCSNLLYVLSVPTEGGAPGEHGEGEAVAQLHRLDHVGVREAEREALPLEVAREHGHLVELLAHSVQFALPRRPLACTQRLLRFIFTGKSRSISPLIPHSIALTRSRQTTGD